MEPRKARTLLFTQKQRMTEKEKKCSRCFQCEHFGNGEMIAPFGISGA